MHIDPPSKTEIDNEDWLKTGTLDFIYRGRRPESIEELEQCIAPMTLEEFLELPAARAIPSEWWDAYVEDGGDEQP